MATSTLPGTPPVSKEYGLFLGDPVDTGTPTYKMVVCATTMTLNRTNNVTKTETKCGVIKAPGTHDYTITLSAVTMINTTAGNMSELDLHNLFKSDRIQAFKIGRVPPDVGDTTYSGEGIVSTLNTTWPTTDNSTFEVTIDVYGEVEGAATTTP